MSLILKLFARFRFGLRELLLCGEAKSKYPVGLGVPPARVLGIVELVLQPQSNFATARDSLHMRDAAWLSLELAGVPAGNLRWQQRIADSALRPRPSGAVQRPRRGLEKVF